jgi:GNAT superfamily N-acetyltransferase/transcriptional antiterminator Rof (Rho-off)
MRIDHPTVERLGPERAGEVISVLADAFTGYPVMRYVLGPHADEHLERLVRLFVMARVLRGEPMFGIYRGSELAAAGIVSFPGTEPAPSAFLTLREQTWRVLGPDAEARYVAYGEATRAFAFPPGAVHLNMIGARSGARRQGLGRAILDAVHELSRTRTGSPGVELTTEIHANVAWYESQGFELVGHARVSAELESWGFFRANALALSDGSYAPIACSLHDQLEAAATLRRPVALTVATADGSRTLTGERVVDIGTRAGAEYARLSSGLDVRLDRILSLDGVDVRPTRPITRTGS